jgi:hypothetical protein
MQITWMVMVTQAEEQQVLGVLEAMQFHTITVYGQTARRTVRHSGWTMGTSRRTARRRAAGGLGAITFSLCRRTARDSRHVPAQQLPPGVS